MTTPAGDITLGDVATELQIALPLTLGDARVLTLRGGGGLPVTLGELRSKSDLPRVELSATELSGESYGGPLHPFPVASGEVTVTITGGTAPVTAEWEQVSGDVMSVLGSYPLTVFFRAVVGPEGGFKSAVYRVVATDANSHVGYSADVTINLTGYGEP